MEKSYFFAKWINVSEYPDLPKDLKNMHSQSEKIPLLREANLNIKKENVIELIDENIKVGSLVTLRPVYANHFEKLGIDYCCKGKKTLKEVCEEKNLDVSSVLEILRNSHTDSQTINWMEISLKDVIIHIVRKHHDYLREELPRLSNLINKVSTKHGKLHPELFELKETFDAFKQDLLEHIEKEEKVVFPAISDLIANKAYEKMNSYLNTLEAEHFEEGDALEKMNRLTNGYIPPKGACTSYHVMLNGLSLLEKDMHEHVHKEMHVLFPRARKECSP